jgi:hypothetical protein
VKSAATPSNSSQSLAGPLSAEAGLVPAVHVSFTMIGAEQSARDRAPIKMGQIGG